MFRKQTQSDPKSILIVFIRAIDQKMRTFGKNELTNRVTETWSAREVQKQFLPETTLAKIKPRLNTATREKTICRQKL